MASLRSQELRGSGNMHRNIGDSMDEMLTAEPSTEGTDLEHGTLIIHDVTMLSKNTVRRKVSSASSTTMSLEEEMEASCVNDECAEPSGPYETDVFAEPSGRSETASQQDNYAESWRRRLEEENLIYRTEEEANLKRCVDSASAGNPIVLIRGASGSGKTRLARTLKNRPERSYLFLSGKFFRRHQFQPYAAIKAAFHEFTAAIVHRDAAQEIRSIIASVLTIDERAALLSMIPTLEPLVDLTAQHHIEQHEPDEYHSSKIGRSDGLQHSFLVFRKFLRAVCSEKHPIVLFFDDVQFADMCSLDVLNFLLGEKHPGLAVVLASDNDTAWTSKQLVELEQKIVFTIQLQNLDVKQVTRFVAKALDYSNTAECESLSEIVLAQTGGNLFSIKEFLIWLQELNLLQFDSYEGWEWDIEKINVALNTPFVLMDFLGRTMTTKLPTEALEVLKVGACFDSNFLNEKLIEYVVGYPVATYLEQCRKEGILVRCEGGSYAFLHDRIQETAYALIPETERELLHVEIARRLWRSLNSDELDRYVLIVISNFYIGRGLIVRDKERLSVATLCLHAGARIAKRSSFFRPAGGCMELGITLMGERGWMNDYNLTLTLHNMGAEMHMCTANFSRMDQLVQQVVDHAKTPLDTIRALGCRIYVLSVTDRQLESVDLGLNLLKTLGVCFPRKSFCGPYTLLEATRLNWQLKGKSDEQLMRLPNLDDPHHLACLHVMQLMILSCMFVRPELFPLVSMKMVKITLDHGLSAYSGMAFSTYGMVLLGGFGDIDGSSRYASLGIRLVESLGVVEYLPRAFAAYYGVVYSWKNRVRGSLEPLLYAHRIGLQTGDLEFAYLCSNCYTFLALHSGVPLPTILRQWSTIQETMIIHKQKTLLDMARASVQSMLFFVDPSENPLSYKGAVADLLSGQREAAKTGKFYIGIQSKLVCMRVAYVFGAFEEASSWFGVFDQMKKMVPTAELVQSHFIRAMICLELAALGKDRTKNLRIAKKTIRAMKFWARKSPHNWLEKLFLLKAGLACIYQQYDKAYEFYTCAIALAKDSGSLYMLALANERCGRNLYAQGLLVPARSFLDEACRVLDEWGGTAKRLALQKDMESMFTLSVTNS